MKDEHWALLRRVYGRSTPAGELRFKSHWRDVSVGAGWPSILKVTRSQDLPENVEGPLIPLRSFLSTHTVAMSYPLGFLGVTVGVAFRAINDKEMMSFVRFPDSASFTCSRFYFEGKSQYTYGKPVVLTEGFADAEAVGRFYPYTMATMGGPVKYALVPLYRRYVTRVYTMMDNDDAGEEAAKNIFWRLNKYGIKVERLEYPRKYNDPADFFLADPDEMRRRLEGVLPC